MTTLAPHRHGRPVRQISDGVLLWLMALPAILWFAAFTAGPLVAMFWISTLDWARIISPSSFAGTANFLRIWHDPVFWIAARNSALQLAVVLPVMLPLAFMLGYYVAARPRGHRTLRVLLFTPALISLAAKSMVFYAILAPTGLLNGILDGIGLPDLGRPWLASSHTAMATIMIVDLWSGIGFTAILFAARLTGLGPEVFEAARIDGARHWQAMWQIAYPMIRDYFGVLLMLQFIWVLFGSAGSILLLTNGGPGNASTNLSFLVYDKAFVQAQIGYSQAVGVVLFFVGLAGVTLIRRAFRPSC